MSIGLIIQFKGVGADKYDAIQNILGLTRKGAAWPDGIISHVAGLTSDGWCVVDTWQSQAHFDKFFAGRLMPAMEKVGGMPQPQVTAFQVHASHNHG